MEEIKDSIIIKSAETDEEGILMVNIYDFLLDPTIIEK